MSAFSGYINQPNERQTLPWLVIANAQLVFLTGDKRLADAVCYTAQVLFLKGSSLPCTWSQGCFLLRVSCIISVTLQLSLLIFSCSSIIQWNSSAILCHQTLALLFWLTALSGDFVVSLSIHFSGFYAQTLMQSQTTNAISPFLSPYFY